MTADVWRVRAVDLPPFWRCYCPQRTAPYIEPTNWSEEEVWRTSILNRQMETTPPLVTLYPVGIWAIALFDVLFVLRELPIAQIMTFEDVGQWPGIRDGRRSGLNS